MRSWGGRPPCESSLITAKITANNRKQNKKLSNESLLFSNHFRKKFLSFPIRILLYGFLGKSKIKNPLSGFFSGRIEVYSSIVLLETERENETEKLNFRFFLKKR